MRNVVRRYSDFAWLQQQLKDNFAYVIVPPVPGKQATGNLDPAFVESRRYGLEKFLQWSKYNILFGTDVSYTC